MTYIQPFFCSHQNRQLGFPTLFAERSSLLRTWITHPSPVVSTKPFPNPLLNKKTPRKKWKYLVHPAILLHQLATLVSSHKRVENKSPLMTGLSALPDQYCYSHAWELRHDLYWNFFIRFSVRSQFKTEKLFYTNHGITASNALPVFLNYFLLIIWFFYHKNFRKNVFFL